MSGIQGSPMSVGAPIVKATTGTYHGRLELTGQRFGRLVVVRFDSIGKQRQSQWLCRCDCGNEKVISCQSLKCAHAKSCGCLKDECGEKHEKGMYKSPEYRTWIRIKTRCENENTPYYHGYGGRGISVCEKWSKSFEAFYADMGDRPSKDHSIDRKDNNGNYEPDNCKWSTRFEQQQNIRLQKSNTSGVNGVSFHTKIKRYVASITVNGEDKYIGCFKLLEEAAKARREAEIKYWGK